MSWYSLEESNPLSYVITGDIPAHWLRDSSHQFVPYLPLLPYDSDLRTLFRGLINLDARHIADKPYCNAFQPPPDSGLPQQPVGTNVQISPPPDNTVYQCKWEIDSLASFLRLSWGYWESTNGDKSMITTTWLNTVQQIMNVLQAQSLPTIADDGSINIQAYIYQPTGSRAVIHLPNVSDNRRTNCCWEDMVHRLHQSDLSAPHFVHRMIPLYSNSSSLPMLNYPSTSIIYPKSSIKRIIYHRSPRKRK